MNAIKKDWWEVFNIEMRRNVHKVTISCTLIFLFLCAIVLQMTVGIYTNLEKKKDEFIEVEKSKIGRYVNYDQYALYGITRLFQSSPLFCLCINTTCFAELVSRHSSIDG